MAMNGRLLRPRASGFDPDALRYITAVQAADGQTLEPAVRKAINDFVVGCKRDGIWSAIKASCILAGARTLAGALTPLVGTAPTNVNNNFVSGDYNRKTGLVGDGTTKYLDTNRNANADPQDNFHMAIYKSAFAAGGPVMGAGGASTGSTQIQGGSYRCRTSTGYTPTVTMPSESGFVGMSRGNGLTFIGRNSGTSETFTASSQTPFNGNVFFYARNSAGTPGLFIAHRYSYYSIGESLNLATLESRVSALVTAIGAAIA